MRPFRVGRFGLIRPDPGAQTEFMPASDTPFHQQVEPGQFVRHPQRPEWGVGQVQSAIGARVTVNFAHAGKVLVNAAVVALDVITQQDGPGGPA